LEKWLSGVSRDQGYPRNATPLVPNIPDWRDRGLASFSGPGGRWTASSLGGVNKSPRRVGIPARGGVFKLPLRKRSARIVEVKADSGVD